MVSKMSVTNGEVSVPAGGIGGGSPPPPTTATSSSISASSTTIASSASGTIMLHNGSLTTTSTPADVVRSGYLRKLKGKKKFFVLRKETGNDKPARLEYYDKEKKFRAAQPPKK